ncbi:putative succinyl-CoA synthetase subunit beta [cyanobacterium endosymbiont of Rhopalodia gibberula]|uniref:ATP-grasp domain-containing protein n=1 Tax=cyanobacterium endosymbiont of Rhopalodia gibberula TaxID=1763363 RepID=UPI000DC73F27|nr:ATP-grasp domain-containing protein [cyanobacterium endosymbiont of Rhopalodia gibberula]BBA78921.1 putative succinyl-CoA synthetase subunit beta [cyanobacterium endosymbiont of Rhopalodia gibberula]
MDLLEYQAKKLFHQVGIPILPSQPIVNLSEIKHLHIPYPVVLKSQVRSGGRGKAGGIRFVENTIDAIVAAQAIFSLAILGEYPEVILAEARYDTKSEFFLSVLLDYKLQRPVLLGSPKGGIDVETLLEHMEKVVVDSDFSPFYARRLAVKMGLQGELIQTVSSILEKMYQIFREKDLDLIEINPLAVSPTGEVMALDGKIAVNDAALSRHRDLVELLTSSKLETSSIVFNPVIPKPLTLPQVCVIKATSGEGNIGIISNGWGLTLTSWELLVHEQGNPACGWMLSEQEGLISLIEQLTTALEQAIKSTHIKVLLINILGNIETSGVIAKGIADYFQPYLKRETDFREDPFPRPTRTNSLDHQQDGQPQNRLSQVTKLPSLVVRLLGDDFDSIKESLSGLDINSTEDLGQAITTTVSLAKAQKK